VFSQILRQGNNERICPVGTDSIQPLIRFLDARGCNFSRNDFVMTNEQGRDLTPLQAQKLLKFYLQQSGLPMDICPHKLRQSYTTYMLNNGADLAPSKNSSDMLN
jgi:site-specific recombinase XerD